MLVGYARVSTTDQNLDLQLDAFKKEGCEQIFTDTTSGAKSDRPGAQKALEYVRAGDTLVVWKLDRLGRNLKHLITTIEGLKEKGVGFRSIQEGMDTGTPMGMMLFHIIGALAEFEREIIRERVNAGLQAARARGRKGGRPRKLSKGKWEVALELYRGRQKTVPQICEFVGVNKTTFYQYLLEEKKKVAMEVEE